MTAWARWKRSRREAEDWKRWLAAYRSCNHDYQEKLTRDEKTGKMVRWRPHSLGYNAECRRCGHGKVVLYPRKRRGRR